MPKRLSTTHPDFARAFEAFLGEKREVSDDVDAAVRGILADVRQRGDAALNDYTQRFDHLDLRTTGLRITDSEIHAAMGSCDRDTLAALYGVIGALMALEGRRRSGKGQVVDVALYEAVFSVMESMLPEFDAFGTVRERTGSFLPGIAPTSA